MTDERRLPDADRPLDASDLRLLHDIALMYDEADPVPDDLVDRVRFALALDEVFEEVAEMTREPADASGVRSDLAGAVRSDTLTFSSERLTAMVTLSPGTGGRVRIDGWVSPLGRRRVDVRMQGSQQQVRTDEAGRFAVDDLRESFVQLVFHALDDDHDDELVVTPLFKL
jgi:hypothetical protein